MATQNQRLAWLRLVLVLTALVLPALTGCAGATKPVVSIVSNIGNTAIVENQEVVVQTMSIDAKGVTRIELVVDKEIVSVATINPPQKTVTVPLTWKATGGSHTLTVRAVNTDKLTSDPATVTVVVSGATTPVASAATPVPVATTAPTGVPTAAPTPVSLTATPASTPTVAPTHAPTATGCVPTVTFVADVTIPDGTQMTPGQSFTKTWRVRNTGNCAWGAGLVFVSTGGTRMSSITQVVVPDTQIGQTADLSVAMTAPAAAGTYTGQWRFRNDSGALIGPVYTVKIVVPGAQPTAQPAPGCAGNARITSFAADRTNVNRGETTVLRWGPIYNADNAWIDNNIGGIATPGERNVAPVQTSTYTLTATCGANVQKAYVTINVNNPVWPTTAPSRANVDGNWSSERYMVELSQAIGCPGPVCALTGRFITITAGAPEIVNISGTINGSAVSFTVPGTMPGAPGMTFNGSANGNTLSGHLSGVGGITFTRQ